MELGKGPGATPPPVPSLQYYYWRLRDSDPGIASASMGSVFSLSSVFLFLLPFFCLPGELRAFALPGAPLLPLPSGAPPLPRHPGAKGGRHFPPSLFGRGMMLSIIPRRQLPSDQGKSRTATPLIREATTRRCRAGFRRRSQFFP